MIPAGRTVTNITVWSGSTAMVAPTNQWFTLVRVSDKAILAKTVDDTNVAWATTTAKTLALSATYTPTVNTLAYIGIVITAGTMPTVSGVIGLGAVNGTAPIVAALADTGLTDPASLVSVGALTATANLGFGYIT
jgi:hypothetical protein